VILTGVLQVPVALFQITATALAFAPAPFGAGVALLAVTTVVSSTSPEALGPRAPARPALPARQLGGIRARARQHRP
jgi:hypothetical protein